MSHQLTAYGTVAIGIVAGVCTAGGVHRVIQGQCSVTIDGQREGNRHITGHKQLLHSAICGGVQCLFGGRLIVGQGHKPLRIVAGLNEDIAIFGKSGSQLAIDKLVAAQIGTVFFATVVSAIDIANQIIILGVSAPSTAATPITVVHCPTIVAVGGQRQIARLVPLIVPVIVGGAGIHAAENNRAVSRGNAGFINAILIGVRHADPGFPCTSKEVRRKSCAVGLPFAVGFQIHRIQRCRKNCGGHHAENHADHQQDTEGPCNSFFHNNLPCFFGLRWR